MEMDRAAFFAKFSIDERQFRELGLSWDELMLIHEDYRAKIPIYEETARYLAEVLNKEKSIHSIRYRVKDSEHLIEKIIRKSAQDPAFRPTAANYTRYVKDLIGLRALHLFKENWADIHRFLADNWEFYTMPKANYKKGDPESLLDLYTQMGCELNEHRRGYRSVHYHLLIKPGRQEMVAEVQVRTLFEEAWSEIDHYFSYSVKDGTDQSAEQYLGVLNNITSNADALASYINQLDALEQPETGEATATGAGAVGMEVDASGGVTGTSVAASGAGAAGANDAVSANDAEGAVGVPTPADAERDAQNPGQQHLNIRDIYKKVRYG